MNSHKKYSFHTAVIGAGSGGLTVAIGLADLKKKVALIDRAEYLGGECTNSGCIPSKALIYAAKAGLGKDALKYVRHVVDKIRAEESPAAMEKHGITVFRGTASFAAEEELEITNPQGSAQTITADNIVIATGSSPITIDIAGLPKEKLHTNETIFNLNEIPKILVVIGAGPIACELAIAFAKLGTAVHIVYRGEGILKKEDPEARQIILRAMDKLGIVFHWNASDYSYENGALKYKTDKRTGAISGADAVLLALGRKPNLAELNLDLLGIKYNQSGILTDGSNLTNVNNVYAIGDVTQSPKFTHLANAQGRQVVQSIAFPYLPESSLSAVPAVTFTTPETASAGIAASQIEAMDQRLVRKSVVYLKDTDRGKTDSIEEGAVIVHAQTLTGKILRATVVAPAAGEMIPYFILAIDNKISLWKIFRTMLPYPVLSMAGKKIADQYAAATLKNIRKEFSDYILAQLTRFIKVYGVKTLAVLFWLGILVGVRLYMSANSLDFADVTRAAQTLIVKSPYGPLIYISLAIFRPLILFPASILTILGGSAFGLRDGFIYSLIGGTASAAFPYFAGVFLAGKQKGEKGIGLLKYAEFIKNNPFRSTLILRLLYMPYDAVSFMAGSVRAGFEGFIFATLIGNLAGTFSYVAIGASVEGMGASGFPRINLATLALSAAGILLVITLSQVLKKMKVFER